MSILPPSQTPLNQHSLAGLELWLLDLGAKKNIDDPSLWVWEMSEWSAEIMMNQDELVVTWYQAENKSQFTFPYGLPRKDVEAALKQGP